MDKLEQIEQYLTGTMSAEGRNLFETEIANNAELKAEVNDYRDLLAGIELAGIQEFEQKIQSWEAQIRKDESASNGQVRPMWTRYLAIAASVILLCSLAYLFWPKQQAPIDANQLFAEHFEPMEDYLSMKGSAQLRDSAMSFYNAGQYPEAINLFEQVMVTDSGEALVQLYTGISYLANNDPSNARAYFQPLAEGNTAYAESAAWYLVLTDVKEGNLVLAQTQLTDISSQEGHAYQQAARELLEQLSR